MACIDNSVCSSEKREIFFVDGWQMKGLQGIIHEFSWQPNILRVDGTCLMTCTRIRK